MWWNAIRDERNFFFYYWWEEAFRWHMFFSWAISEMFPLFKQLDEDLRQNLKTTMQQKYGQPGEERVTQAVDNLQQEVQLKMTVYFWRQPFKSSTAVYLSSSNAVAATITLTGLTTCGFSSISRLFLIAVAKPTSRSAAAETIPQISTNWRYSILIRLAAWHFVSEMI